MINFRIEYTDFDDEEGGFTRYVITVKGESLPSIEREFYDKVQTAWDAVFMEVNQ